MFYSSIGLFNGSPLHSRYIMSKFITFVFLCEFSINLSHFSLSYILLSRLFHTKQDLVSHRFVGIYLPENICLPVVLLSSVNLMICHNSIVIINIVDYFYHCNRANNSRRWKNNYREHLNVKNFFKKHAVLTAKPLVSLKGTLMQI